MIMHLTQKFRSYRIVSAVTGCWFLVLIVICASLSVSRITVPTWLKDQFFIFSPRLERSHYDASRMIGPCYAERPTSLVMIGIQSAFVVNAYHYIGADQPTSLEGAFLESSCHFLTSDAS